MRVVAIVVSLAITVVAVALAVKAVRDMLAVIRAGRPAIGRSDDKKSRWINMFKETLGHTRMLQWHAIGIMHWFVFAGFIFLSSMVAGAYLQIFDAHQALPIIGHWYVYEWPAEVLSWLTLIGIVYLIAVRQKNHPRSLGRKSRFFGSNFWQAYFVETIIFLVVLCGFALRSLEYAMEKAEHGADGLIAHYPLTFFLGDLWGGLSVGTMENLVYLIAMIKIVISMTWLITIARNITMGVAWHRFTAWFNIWFKRNASGAPSLGALPPIYVQGKPLDMEAMEDLDEEDFEKLGVGKVEDFTWKGILDFTTCTECGRCQSQCPAWNTEKPLSPKLLMMGLRDHAYTKLPLLGAEESTLTEAQRKELERPLIGDAEMYGVIDPDVLWSCTNCGACVQQCPVDIEHVDHIEDMRRFQVLVESNFPAELNNIFKGLERKGNPWGMNPKGRMDWAKDLDFEVKQVGVEVEDLDEVDWLFWVGCAGAFEDRAKKTTQAVAELLDMAGVTFAVLGDGETCNGDPARRAGNEIVFQQLAMQNVEVFKETKVKKVVSTCAHCFNTLKNEYKEFGVELEVVHHTQLLNRLVREGRLTPVAPGADAPVEEKQKITYHDPCFLGRHNKVYEPPRELLQVIPGAEFVEMPRNTEKSFCCGAGGARMWMEETLGSRINVNRTEEAIATGADKIAVGCPFCRVMLSDGLTLKQSEGAAREEVEVLDVAQMLLTAVKRAPVEPSAEDDESVVAEAEAATAAAATGGGDGDGPSDDDVAKATEAEPNAEDRANPDSISETEDAAPLADAQDDSPAEDDTTGASVQELDEPADGGGADQADKDVATMHNVEVDDRGGAQGPPTDAPVGEKSEETGSTAIVDEPAVEEPTDETDAEPAAEAPAEEAPDKAPAEEVTDVPADSEPEPVEEDAREEEADAVPAAEGLSPEDKEKAAWSNVGPVNTGDQPAEETPAEEVTDVPADSEPEPVEEDAREEEADAVPAAEGLSPEDKEKAAWANVGPVNTDDGPTVSDDEPTPEPAPEPGDVTEADSESVPDERATPDDEPAGQPTPSEETPAEEVTDVPADSEPEPVEQDARDEEADAADGPTAQASTPEVPAGEVVSVDDVPSTADPVSDDAAPLSDANPQGADVSESATALAADDDEDTTDTK
jgi:Fe-S oxidoreductase